MAHTVVCISIADGSEGHEVATLVAQSLGFRLFDEEIVMNAALEAGVQKETVADVERKRSTVMRLLDGLGNAGLAMGYVPVMDVPVYGGPGEDELRNLIRSVIEETASSGSAVIVAHAASLALREREEVLRVLVTASPSIRASRLAASLSISDDDAAKRIKRGDEGRADYMRRFYKISEESASLYDLVLNTDRLKPADVADLIVRAAGAPEAA